MVKVYEDDSVEETARKIFEDFTVLQSCTITGYCMLNENKGVTKDKNLCVDVAEKGELVWQRLRKLDEGKYARLYGKKLVRIRTKIPNSIGDFVSQPIFSHHRRKDEEIVKWAIWRRQ